MRAIPAKGVSSHVLEGQLLVFSEQTQTLYELNSAAAFVWCCYEDGMNPARITRELAEATGIPPKTAEADVLSIVVEWISLGLLTIESEEDECNETLSHNSPLPANRMTTILSPTIQFCSQFQFILAGSQFLIRFSGPEQKEKFRPFFLHLESCEESVETVFDLVQDERGYLVSSNNLPIGRCASPDEVRTLITQEAIRVACLNADSLIAVHAAIVGDRDRCIMFPGASGAGKTTLAAAFTNAGFRYFAEEVGIVEHGTHRPIPCPTSLCIKNGVWDVIPTLWESFQVAAVGSQNGRPVRYLRPPAGSFALDPEEGCPVEYMVFPQYSPEIPTSLSPLSKIEAFRRIQEAGYEVPGLLDSNKVNELVEWIQGIDCYELRMQSPSTAVQIIVDLLS